MLSKKVLKALNDQMNAETNSAYLYLAMSAHFDSMSLRGLARWMRAHSDEERGHALKFFDFIIQRGGQVRLATIEAPPAEWKSPLALFEEVLEHEKMVSGRIDALTKLAQTEDDPATVVFLQHFVAEQVEEEATFAEIVAKLRMIKDSPGGLLFLDHHMGKRGSE